MSASTAQITFRQDDQTHFGNLDLRPYIAKGFSPELDRLIAEVGVAGIDKQQALSMVRLCPATEGVLYGPTFSPRKLRYRRGSRPVLEKIVGALGGQTTAEKAQAAMDWVYRNVAHPFEFGQTAPDRGMTEEQLIESKVGWCNEQARVFVALCEVMEIPGRMCFLVHSNRRCGHTTAEVLVQGKWAFFDPTFKVCVRLPDRTLGEGRELSGGARAFAHAAFGPAFARCYPKFLPYVESGPWCAANRPTIAAGGDLLDAIGICNYVIDGCTTV